MCARLSGIAWRSGGITTDYAPARLRVSDQVVRVLPQRNSRDLAAEVIKALGHAGFEIQGSYVPIHLLGNFDKCIWDRLPHAERVWADLIELPCEPGVSFDDVERIATIVKETVTS
jgi:dTDP-4-amino-4,6-dideoxygalactose transaminase